MDGLLIAPPICRLCLGFSCEAGECTRPWMRVEGESGILLFESITAAYLSIGPGAEVLKSWKVHGGPTLTRALGLGVQKAVQALPRVETLLIPVPQSEKRKWDLNGGSVLRVCEMLKEANRRNGFKTEVFEALELFSESAINQGRTQGDGRYTRKQSIRMKPEARALLDHQNIADQEMQLLLVDDLLTSGATLRSALEALRIGFESSGLFRGRRTRISAFVLGFRPSLSID